MMQCRSVRDFLHRSPLRRRLVGGTVWSAGGAIASRFSALASSVASGRILGKTGLGELGMIQSTGGMFAVFGGFGMGMTGTKYVSESWRSSPRRTADFIASSLVVAFIAGGIAAMAQFAGASWLAEKALAAPHLSRALRIGSVQVWLSSLNLAQTSILTGFEAFRTLALFQGVSGVVALPLVAGGAYFGGVEGATWGTVASTGFSMAAGHYFVRRESLGRGIEQVWIPRFAELSALWKFTVPALIVGMAFMPATWAANAMLVRQENGYAEMGVFNAATQWRNAYQFIPSIIYTAAFPVLSQLLANKDQASFKKLALAQLGSSVGIVALLFVGAIPLAPMLMASFGSQFAGHTRVFVLTTVNAVPFTFSSVAGALMLAANKPWWAAAGALLWAAVLLAAAGPAVTFGALGLAASHLLAYMAMAGWCAYFLSRLGVFARRG